MGGRQQESGKERARGREWGSAPTGARPAHGANRSNEIRNNSFAQQAPKSQSQSQLPRRSCSCSPISKCKSKSKSNSVVESHSIHIHIHIHVVVALQIILIHVVGD